MIASSDYSIYSNDIAMIGMIDLDIVMIASLDLDKSFRCNLILLPSGLSEQFNSNFFFGRFNSSKKLSESISTESDLSAISLRTKSMIPPPSIFRFIWIDTPSPSIRNFPSVKLLSRLDSDIIRTSIYPSIISFCWSSLFLTELMLRCAKVILSTLFLGKNFNLVSGNPTK